MIDNMWDYLLENALGMKMDNIDFISKVLEAAEVNGMKPPGYSNDEYSEEGVSYNSGYYHSGWEPEDET
jgi:hypothetical protein